jgi:Fe-S-cluster containining protein
MIKEIINRSYEIMNVFSDLERAIGFYKMETGIDCLRSCGHCCNNPDVEASPGEFLPLALKLWESGGATKVLSKINDLPERSVCVFYTFKTGDPEKGFCSIYNYRGLICRLFGFTAAANKNGENTLITCRLIKNRFVHEMAEAENSGIVPPLMEEYTRTFEPLIAEFGNVHYPINQAIRVIVEKIGFLLTLYSSEQGINY